MTNYTQKAILQTFEEMLAEMPFDKITVSQLVKRCNISSNTFYYHFHDIYDLLKVWLSQKCGVYSQTFDEFGNWADSLKFLMRDMKDNPKLVFHLSGSISIERTEDYLFSTVEELFYKEVDNWAHKNSVKLSNLQGISSIACYAVVGFVTKFIWSKMTLDYEAAIDSMKLFFDHVLENILSEETDSGGFQD